MCQLCVMNFLLLVSHKLLSSIFIRCLNFLSNVCPDLSLLIILICLFERLLFLNHRDFGGLLFRICALNILLFCVLIKNCCVHCVCNIDLQICMSSSGGSFISIVPISELIIAPFAIVSVSTVL